MNPAQTTQPKSMQDFGHEEVVWFEHLGEVQGYALPTDSLDKG